MTATGERSGVGRSRRTAAAAILLLLSTSCLRPGETPAVDDDGPSVHRIRLLDGQDEPIGAIRLTRRNATISDATGVRIGRAAAIQHRIVVRDRGGAVALVFRPAGNGSGDSRVAVIEREDGLLLGQITFGVESIDIDTADGFRQGQVRFAPSEEGDDEMAEVYGAPGTDLLYRVRSSGRRQVEVVDAADTRLARLEGIDLLPWQVAVMALPAPWPSDEEPPAGLFQLYRVGVLLYARVLLD